jgi:NADH:quinone reductase (non-electrogenic)
MTSSTPDGGHHRVVVIGGGFAGINAVKRLSRADVDVTLVDRRNFHLFQPLTYQVATGALSPGEIAYPLRAIFKGASNVSVLLAEVTGFDLHARSVWLAPVAGTHAPRSVSYDTLIVAGGSTYSYFGHDEWSRDAIEVKSLESALAARARILTAFERAEAEQDPAARGAELTFVVVGAGPTGVEMAGQIGELARETLRTDFRSINPAAARIVLIETGDRVLTSFPPSLADKAAGALGDLGVSLALQRTVVDVTGHGVTVEARDGAIDRIPARTVIWAAGVQASPLGRALAEQAGGDVDRAGRLTVEHDLTLPGHPEVLVLGDMVRVRTDGDEARALPGLAPVAMQQGSYAGRLVDDRLRGRRTPPFRYRDKGNLATIGRARAVADLRGVRLSGPLAWSVWLVVHLWYLIGFQNRLLVLTRWAFSFVTRGRGARLITAAGGSATVSAPEVRR